MAKMCVTTIDSSDTRSNEIDTEASFLPLEGCSSAVWKFFGFPARNGKIIEPDKKKRKEVHRRVCGCEKVLKYSGNTSNMLFHLEHCHPSIYAEIQASRSTAASSTAKGSTSRQLTLKATVASSSPISRSSLRWKKITDALCYFLAKDMQPLEIVNDQGFRHLLQEIEPRYIPPDRKTI